MNPKVFPRRVGLCLLLLLISLAVTQSVAAQEPQSTQTFRDNYDALLKNFERIAASSGDKVNQQASQQARKVLRALTNDQLAQLFEQGTMPDVSVAVVASRRLASRMESKQKARSLAAARLGNATTATLSAAPLSAGFPGPMPVVADCNGIDIEATTRYDLLIAKEVASGILAAAAWVCNQDAAGVNTSTACVGFAIAADVAIALYDTATFCSGEVTSNQVDANFNRLGHIHTDLADGIATIVSNSDANRITIVNNSDANRTTIVNNDNANLVTIINNANANKNELRDLILRTQIEADLAMVDGSAVVALYEIPDAKGGYLNLVKTIVTETLAHVKAAGGSVGNAQAFLNTANAANTAGNFKSAYAYYRRAYKAAGN